MNKLSIKKINYETDADFNQAIGNMMRFLADNDYQMKCYWDEKSLGIFIIEFDYKDVVMTGYDLVWEKEE